MECDGAGARSGLELVPVVLRGSGGGDPRDVKPGLEQPASGVARIGTPTVVTSARTKLRPSITPLRSEPERIRTGRPSERES